MSTITFKHKQTQERSCYIRAESPTAHLKQLSHYGYLFLCSYIKLLLNTTDYSTMWTDENSKYKQEGDNTHSGWKHRVRGGEWFGNYQLCDFGKYVYFSESVSSSVNGTQPHSSTT